tara:strand:- start:2518 stop:4101 length:1584 start_codon:yes stop_codon:yes gene_type:complete
MSNKIKTTFFGLGIIFVVLAIILVTRQPTASINRQESLELRKNQLTKQMLSVFDEEAQLTNNSLDLTEDFQSNLLAPKLRVDPFPYQNEKNWPPIEVPYIKESIELAKSKDTNKDSLISIPSTNLAENLAERKLDFDLSYSLILRTVTPASDVKFLKRASGNSDRWINVSVKTGDSLSVIFERLKLNPQLAINIARQKDAVSLSNLRLGSHLKILVRAREFLELRYQINALTTLHIVKKADQFDIKKIKRKFDITQRTFSGSIKSSLFESGINDGLEMDLLYELSSIFQWKIDFNRDLRPGDTYTLIYEEKSLDGKLFGSGPILAADITLNGKQYRAIRHVDEIGRTQYFTPEGESLEGLFLRSPMKISRITSKFSNRRFHPVLKEWRAHKGVDYGGVTGDPVMATGDGIVTFAGWKGNYGRTVIIQHGKQYSTLYAHLSKFKQNVGVGNKVNQGQIIGYLGSSGLTTGPHLHYEFRVNGVHKNPLTVKLPRTFAIDRASRPKFFDRARNWTIQLDQARSKTGYHQS